MKILVMGTSHTAALRDAADWIGATYPDLDVTYFSLPGFYHARAQMNGPWFGPAKDDDKGRDISLQMNGCTAINLDDFAHILHIGSRFSLVKCSQLMADFDILGHPTRTGRPLMTRAAALGLIAASVEQDVATRSVMADHDPRFTFMPAPYPLARSRMHGAGHEPALSRLDARDTAQDWADTYSKVIQTTLANVENHFLAQPVSTLAAPFFTDNIYALTEDTADNRHMNASFGQAVFAHFATHRLGLDPVTHITAATPFAGRQHDSAHPASSRQNAI
ncbi:hypothetical protein EDD53_1466 [Pacificibacter maritimus]|uniref:Uncharacterized protein n=1 Tax=Pacificibacter maritimus TaxID=762213 RepID=A0A3N4U9B9_9RHOB|nr:hypothetical protein [Pacificibacter maritimus]RPE67062.1 hypothetical protein EDD53_1466 [Pacificibacter maritimus]